MTKLLFSPATICPASLRRLLSLAITGYDPLNKILLICTVLLLSVISQRNIKFYLKQNQLWNVQKTWNTFPTRNAIINITVSTILGSRLYLSRCIHLYIDAIMRGTHRLSGFILLFSLTFIFKHMVTWPYGFPVYPCLGWHSTIWGCSYHSRSVVLGCSSHNYSWTSRLFFLTL